MNDSSGIVPLQDYYLFPRYQTREDYRRATGLDPAEFNPAKLPKYWRDSSAPLNQRNSIVYPNAILMSERGTAVVGADGKPQLDMLVLSKVEAAAVNIPVGSSNEPGSDQPEVPMPLRDFEVHMQLEFGFGGVVRLRDTRTVPPDQQGDFTTTDRALLVAIGKKLGV